MRACELPLHIFLILMAANHFQPSPYNDRPHILVMSICGFHYRDSYTNYLIFTRTSEQISLSLTLSFTQTSLSFSRYATYPLNRRRSLAIFRVPFSLCIIHTVVITIGFSMENAKTLENPLEQLSTTIQCKHNIPTYTA